MLDGRDDGKCDSAQKECGFHWVYVDSRSRCCCEYDVNAHWIERPRSRTSSLRSSRNSSFDTEGR